MSFPLQSIVALYAFLLEPIPQLAALGLPVGILDVVGTLRLALAVKQIKHALRLQGLKKAGKASLVNEDQGESLLSSIWPMLVIVYGGELFVSSFVSQPPSFFVSSTGPVLITLCHLLITAGFKYAPNVLPAEPSLKTELPFAIVDAFTRAVLLCSLGPPAILGHKSVTISNSPVALLLTSTVLANGGFFLVNTFSMLSPFGWELATPPELKPWGWTSMDLLCAPSITGLFATLTRSQTLWTSVNDAAVSYAGYGGAFNATGAEQEKSTSNGSPESGGMAMDPESARALCALVLVGMFGSKAIRNYGMQAFKYSTPPQVKAKTQ